ncbi:S8 family peptidase [Pseudobacillus wudalianchiensis]|uniref:Peptidase S8 n=1 Tax=Pseudobacillus wudalianchiensis TaxID=1743143 RepID=A0A1B9ATP0_9BACI|nr:S8 family peptidase [Bacillus wudalianchiensis]OCA87252.1 peptidase S8 [Bacillus wudalianchiensis]
MRRRVIIGVSIFLLGIGAVMMANLDRPSREPEIYSRAGMDERRVQVQNLQHKSPHIQKVDTIQANEILKKRLNNDPSIQMIHHNAQDKSHYYANEVVVDFSTTPSGTSLDKIAKDIDGALKEKHNSSYIFKSYSKTTTELIQYFKQNHQIRFAEPHYIYLQNEVNDTYYQNYQWNLPAIRTEVGWNVTRGSKKIKIAVVDTGVDLNHPDLSRRLTKGYNALSPKDPPQDDNGHGTHVAGIIASVPNNGVGVAGITWYNPIIPVKVLNSEGTGGSFDVSKGIHWAADHGADVINLSLGNYQPSAVMEEAIRYAMKKDVVVVSAAGNDNSSQPSFPAAYPGVLGVAAVDWEGRRAPFSNYGDYIDIAAPGVHIASTFFQGQYASLSGTSMAAPHVSALAGLIRSIDPNLRNTEVMNIMTRTTQQTERPRPAVYYGNGVIDNTSALEAAYRRKYPLGRTSEWFNQFFGR